MANQLKLRLKILKDRDHPDDTARAERCWELFRKLPLNLATKIRWLLDHKGQLYVGLHDDQRTLTSDEHRTLLLLWRPEPVVHICTERRPAKGEPLSAVVLLTL